MERPGNEALAILGVILIVCISLITLGPAAKDVALAVGGGLIGYLKAT